MRIRGPHRGPDVTPLISTFDIDGTLRAVFFAEDGDLVSKARIECLETAEPSHADKLIMQWKPESNSKTWFSEP